MFRISFLVDDKYVTSVLHALANKTRGLEVVPVVNAKAKANGKVHEIAANRTDLLHKELKAKGVKEFNAKMAQETMEYLNLKSATYFTTIARGIEQGLFKKGKRGKGMTGHTYLVM